MPLDREIRRGMVAQSGDAVGPYEIIEQIGAGGMATVYKAYHEKLDRYVALKLMHTAFSRDASFLARFEREAKIVAKFDHPNIVPLYDYDDFGGQPYLTMKFIEGMTLKDVLREGALSADDIMLIARPVADALSYAHDLGVLHRDVKPSNILIDPGGRPYLTDFGLARLLQQGESTMSADVMLGTPHYISPEQAQGGVELDSRTDVYSLGVVLYEMTTGQTPFSGETSYAIIHNHIYTPPPSPREVDPEVPGPVADALLKALAKDANERYDSPTALVAAYRSALEGGATPAAKRPTPVKTPPAPPAPPKPAKPAEPIDELRAAGEEIKQAFKTIGGVIRSEMNNSQGHGRGARGRRRGKVSRFIPRPGTEWTKDPYGNEGFYTKKEIEAMEQELDPETRLRRRVEKRLEERRDFFGHLTAYVMVNLMLWTIWALTGGGHPWPIYPMFGWGIGITIHFITYYTEHGAGRERREQFIQREIDRERAKLYGEKPKRDDMGDAAPVRLTGDGELTDSFMDELGSNKQKRDEGSR